MFYLKFKYRHSELMTWCNFYGEAIKFTSRETAQRFVVNMIKSAFETGHEPADWHIIEVR